MGLQLSRTETVIGLPAVTARDIIKIVGNSGDRFFLPDVERALEVKVCFKEEYGRKYPDHEAARLQAPALLSKMIQEGYVAEDGLHQSEQWGERMGYKLTNKGGDLARVKFVKRISQAQGLKLLNDFLDRVRQVNDPDSPYVFYVKNAWLYGSMLDADAADIGDVDLVVECLMKDKFQPGQRIEACEARAEAVGRNVSGVHALYFCCDEVKVFLKARKAHLSLDGFTVENIHEIKDGVLPLVVDGVVPKRIEKNDE
ncbi:hypothetical protein N1937_05240 [Rhizobium sp. WSM4643]|uniref:hypothetical protein n=1 Tax=Rhizobium sp. WSM4643 TaxID=3138253 RepID=UPI0021A69502|nr:hypothetical protein [Rhizobium leguminosarum]UWM76645.1 hypothetical protein N1937_05240 [Rhizobium leguminosarum bv. viciae]